MDEALLQLNNKADVIRLIANDSPPSIIFNTDDIPYDALRKTLASNGAIVIKPALSAGAKGIFEVNTENDIKNIYHSMKKEQKKQAKILEQEWIAQSKIDGTLYSLEGFVANGVIHTIGLSRRTRIQYTESRNEFPVEDEINTESYQRIKAAVENLVKTSNYKNGYFHSEFLVNDQNVFLIDANFGRVAGGGIAMQMALASGKTIAEIYAHVVDVTFFGDKAEHEYFYPSEKMKTLSIDYGVNQAAKLIKIELPKEMKSQHVQLIDDGKVLQPVGYNNRSWIGLVIGERNEVLKDMSGIAILTDNGSLNPVF